MWNPFRRETRSGDGSGSGSYNDAVVSWIVSQAQGNVLALPGATAAAEMASGIACRAFMLADVEGTTQLVKDALTSDVRGMIARSMCRHGQALFRIRVAGGRIMLDAADSVTVSGSYDRDSWTYLVSLPGPSETVSFNLSASQVLHCRYAADQGQPWRGVGPLQSASLAARLAAGLAGMLADESSGPRGYLLPIPKTDGDADEVEGLKSDLSKLAGRLHLVESMAEMWDGTGKGPAGYDVKRIGAMIPAPLIQLQELASKEILAAYGVSPALFGASDGTSAREAWRQCLHSFLMPLARGVEDELREKLDAPELRLDFSALSASDISGRARAFGSMVQAGMDPGKAAALTGLISADE